jgi:hypothetical protein
MRPGAEAIAMGGRSGRVDAPPYLFETNATSVEVPPP